MQNVSVDKSNKALAKFFNNPVCIILGSYNGEKYIEEQILSIINQSHSNWRLIVRDDGSTDNTKKIVQFYTNKDERIALLNDDQKNLGPSLNFGKLLQFAYDSDFDIIFFCDQDDVWSKDKLKRQLEMMCRIELEVGENTPIMVYSDLAVVDNQLQLLDSSFMHYQGLLHENENLTQLLLAQNIVTGCAAAINRELAAIALPVPHDTMMHDWWLALCCSIEGKIGYLDKPLVFYRQHDDNKVGAKRVRDLLNPFKQSIVKRWRIGSLHFHQTIVQSIRLLQLIDNNQIACDKLKKETIKCYSMFPSYASTNRLRVAIKHRFHRQGLIRNFLFYLRILLMK